MAFFMIGIVLYKKFSFFNKWKHYIIIPYIIIPCLVLFILEQYLFKTHIIKPIAFGFMVFYFAYTVEFLNNFGKYGDFTYGIYIYHFPIIQVFSYLGFFKHYPYLSSISVILTTITLAVFSWYFLELKFLSKNRQERQRRLISNKLY